MDTRAGLPIYLDSHATTRVDPRVAQAIVRCMDSNYGNPNSVDHVLGEQAYESISTARKSVSRLAGVEPSRVCFTSGATHSIKLALSLVLNVGARRIPLRVAASVVEHRAVLETLKLHERAGALSIHWIGVDRQARLDVCALETSARDGLDLICVMAANNEVGNVYPIPEVAEIAVRYGCMLLVDSTQAFGHSRVAADSLSIAYQAVSAHKLYGPKGVGALIGPAGLAIPIEDVEGPVGTPNVPGIVGFGEACRICDEELEADSARAAQFRDELQRLLLLNIDDVRVNGDLGSRLCRSLHISAIGASNDIVTARLRRTVAVSTGAACSSGAQEPSHVLQAMGLSSEETDSALRIGVSRFNTQDEAAIAADLISEAIEDARGYASRS